MTFVELVRVSTTGQAERGTPEIQRHALDQLAEHRPGQCIERIEALGVSGARPIHETREGRRLLELAAAGFDELRLWDMDRALGARADDPRDRLAILSVAKQAGAVIVDCTGKVIDPESMVGELEVYLRGLFAATERKKINERMTAGKKRAAARGKVAVAYPPYGYHHTRNNDKGVTIVEEHAEVVRAIYGYAIEGKSLYGIVRTLDADGIRAPRGKWSRTTVRHILRSKTYLGSWRNLGHEIPVPQIIDRETWHRAQRALDKRASRGRPGKKATALVRGRVWCPCGARCYLTRSGARVYLRCASRTIDSMPQCKYAAITHRTDAVDPVVWDAIRDAILSGNLGQAIEDEPDTTAHAETIASCEAKLAKLVKAELRALSLADDGLLTGDALRAKLRDIAGQRGILTATQELAERELAAAATLRADTRSARLQVEALRDAVVNATDEAKMELIAAMVPGDRPFGITVWPDGRIDIIGAVAASTGANNLGELGSVKVFNHCPIMS